MTTPELLRPLRTEAEATAALAAKDKAQPWWRFRWARQHNPMPGLANARLLGVHVMNADPKSALR